MGTTITQVEWMDLEAATNDNDAIDANMHALAGDAELILRATQKQSAVMLVVCYYSGAAATAGAADSSTPMGASSPSLLWSSDGGSNTCASGSLFPRLCLVETVSPVQKTFSFFEKLALLHLVPIDEAPASSSMLRAVCVLYCCCVRE